MNISATEQRDQISHLCAADFGGCISGSIESSVCFLNNCHQLYRWTFSRGVLEMQAEDASALRLEVDNGNMSTVQVTLLQDGLEIEVFQQPWSL